MITLQSVLVAAIMVAMAILFRRWRRRSRLPPGPSGWPVIGSILDLDPNAPQIALTSWAQKYGDIYTVRLLGTDVIVLSGDDVIREAAVTNPDAFGGRPNFFRMDDLREGHFTITFTDLSERWKRLKKVMMNAMKMYGEGLLRLEELTLDVIKTFLDNVEARGTEPFDPLDDIQASMATIVFSICHARRLEDKEIDELLNIERVTNALISPTGRGVVLDMAPWLRFFPSATLRQLRDISRKTFAFYGPKTGKRKTLYDGVNIECVVDALLQQQEKANRDPVTMSLPNREIDSLLADMVQAGISTSSAALYSLIGLCVTHPDLQRRLQAEIDDVLGERTPRLSDRPQMALVEAAILELLRYISHVPLSIPHKTTKRVEMKDYVLPKGTEVLLNLWSMHHDPRYWKDPWDYKPERFLTPEGALVPPDHPNRKRMMAFGAGRRVCLGETLAKNRLFLIVTSLLQRYTFVPAADDKLPKTDPRTFTSGIVLYPQRYKIRRIARHDKTDE